MKKIFKILAILKNYVMYSQQYLAMLNSFLIILIFKKTYNINISAFIILPIGVIFMVCFGYLHYKFILPYEIEHNNKQNDVRQALHRIEDSINNQKLYKK